MSYFELRRSRAKPPASPVIRRTRSWRGMMQVRFDDTGYDRSRMLKQAFFWAPVRIFGTIFVLTSTTYLYLGHDMFMHAMMGYESEMQFEAKVNPTEQLHYGHMLEKDRAWKSPVRNLEKPLHPIREFDLLKDRPKVDPK